MDIIRVYKSNKNMTKAEQKEHIKRLANERQKRFYRKKKMEQMKKNEVKIFTKKINLDDNNDDYETDSNIEDNEYLIELLENVKFDNSENDNEKLEAINILEDKLGVEKYDKLISVDIDIDSDSDSDSDIDSDSD
tara:strand:- start:260 stop:664 length:405 start_codon:yes stop_codon:yes gene_type:complete